MAYEKIDVVIHPTSVVHGLARFRDGASLAHLGHPDMRVPISFALTYPERAATPVRRLDLVGTTLEFEEPDLETFPAATARRKPASAAEPYPCVYNAANEVAVEGFLDGRLLFLGIADAVEEAPSLRRRRAGADLDDLARPTRPRGRSWRAHELARSRSSGSRSSSSSTRRVTSTRRAARMRPALHLGFPPAIAKVNRGGIEYGIGAIPLGGYVKIPGCTARRRPT